MHRLLHKRLRNVLLHIVSPWLLYVIVMIAYVDNFVCYDRSRFCLICPSLRQILENATCREVTHFERYNFHPTHGPSLPIKHGSLSKTAVIRKSSQMVWLSFASSWDKRVMNFIERSNSCHWILLKLLNSSFFVFFGVQVSKDWGFSIYILVCC